MNFSRCDVSHIGLSFVAARGLLREIAVYDCVKVGSLAFFEDGRGSKLEVVIVAGNQGFSRAPDSY